MDLRRELTDEWCRRYQEVHGCKYFFQGVKDASAASRLLKLGMSVEELINIAQAAWEHMEWFNCKQSASLAGFACRFNEIRQELKKPGLNGAMVMVWRDELNRVIARKQMIARTYGDHQTWRKSDAEEYKKLSERLVQLRKNLGVLV